MGCEKQIEVILSIMKRYALKGRVHFVDLHEIYEDVCPDGDESCKSGVRKAILALREQGLIQVHYKAKNHRGVRLSGWLLDKFKEIDQAYRYERGLWPD